MPAPASCTRHPATAARTSTSGRTNARKLQARGIDTTIPFTVDADGFFTKDAPGFEGKRVIDDKGNKGDANEAVIKALVSANALIARGRLKHQYPHSWRSKKPVIFRNTPQWFIAMDKAVLPAASGVSPTPHPSPLPTRGRGTDGFAQAAQMQSGGATDVPSPLWGRDREGGFTSLSASGRSSPLPTSC